MKIFTFHNVSINSQQPENLICAEMENLHSTMFLLIHSAGTTHTGRNRFTFHNVSINSQNFLKNFSPCLAHLHSTMFLLILDFNKMPANINVYLHSTMFLLIL